MCWQVLLGSGVEEGEKEELCVLVRACALENEDLVSSVTLGLKRDKSQWKNLRREMPGRIKKVGQWVSSYA